MEPQPRANTKESIQNKQDKLQICIFTANDSKSTESFDASNVCVAMQSAWYLGGKDAKMNLT